jgi:hypothetical protein
MSRQGDAPCGDVALQKNNHRAEPGCGAARIHEVKMNDYENGTRHARSSVNEYFVDAGYILRYLIGNDDKLDTLIICNPNRQRFVTTDEALYHALGSIKAYDSFKPTKLAKFFEVVGVRSVAKKQVLTDAMVEKIRAEALRN